MRDAWFTPENWMDKFGEWFVPIPETGCWIWMRSVQSNGYGQMMINSSKKYAHRISYELLRKPIPAGLCIDHLCRVRCCVNPAHMEVVTQRENMLRGVGVSAKAAAKTSCDWGHEFTPENTRFERGRRGHMDRRCVQCTKFWSRVGNRKRSIKRAAARALRKSQSVRLALCVLAMSLSSCGAVPTAPNEKLAVYCPTTRGDLAWFGNHKMVAKGCMGFRIPWDGHADPVVVR